MSASSVSYFIYFCVVSNSTVIIIKKLAIFEKSVLKHFNIAGFTVHYMSVVIMDLGGKIERSIIEATYKIEC